MSDFIRVRGAREHNLKDVSLDIPRNKLVVITGLSGSGKSSLAFDTLYAEGQRRYVESLSAYARQFLELMQKPDVDAIEGLSPAISIEQKTTSKNPRSTVATVTEIHDYLRLLYARIGTPYSPMTGLPIEAQTVSQMVDRLMKFPEKSRLLLLAPLVQGRKGEYRKELLELRKKGYQRVKIDGTIYDLDDLPTLEKNIKHDIAVVVDRVVIQPGTEQRLTDSIETILNLSEGLLITENADTKETTLFSAKFACPVSGFTLSEIEPRLFSFNNPHGACPECTGLGVKIIFDPALIIPNPQLSLRGGAIAPWSTASGKRKFHTYGFHMLVIDAIARHFNVSTEAPFETLPDHVQKTILYGSDEIIPISYKDRHFNARKPFEGVLKNLERRWHETDSNWMRQELAKYQTLQTCTACQGYRLKPEALCVKIQDKHIGQVVEYSISEALHWLETLTLTAKQQEIGTQVIKEIRSRLHFLVNVGLDYLTLSRNSGTLSGGESQRIRLASQIGSGLTGVLYVLDEPSIGLHQRDQDRLLITLKQLRDIGNSVLVVEHDEDAIRSADHIIDMGPGAGRHGGHVIAEGPLESIFDEPKSLTGQYLSGNRSIPIPPKRREAQACPQLILQGASTHNLKNIDVTFPLGLFTCITGVSGSGKSSLIIETLFKILAKHFYNSRELPGPFSSIVGLEYIDKVVDIDQSPIGRTPRSNPATYVGCFTPIREWFAGLPEAQARGYEPGRFSFNVKGGRCEACQGDGVSQIEMHFLPDVYVQCDQCHGRRYNRETLEVTYKDKSIADVLDMTVDEGVQFFENHPRIRHYLSVLQRVGLGYIHIGQQATTLSGGEAQRVKLAKELSSRATGKTLYILDEPTTGLHFEDIRKLLEVLQALVNQGNTVIVIEHNLEVIKTADWIIDLGPEGGSKGGNIVATGSPEDILKCKKSYTAHYLAPYLSSTISNTLK